MNKKGNLITLSVLVLLSVYSMLFAGPVNSPGSFPDSEMNSTGDFVLTGNYKTIVKWNGRYSSPGFSLKGNGSDFFSSGISERNDEFSGPAAIACSGTRAALYYPERTSFFPGGEWDILKDYERGYSEHGSIRCAMLSNGSWAVLDLNRNELNIKNKITIDIDKNNLALLTILQNHFVVLTDQRELILVSEDGEVQQIDSTFPYIHEYSRFKGKYETLIYADDYRTRMCNVSGYSSDGFPILTNIKSIPINVCDEEQVCGISIASDNSWIISGYWGSWLGQYDHRERVNIIPYGGDRGCVAVSHSGSDGEFVFSGEADGDMGTVGDIKIKNSDDEINNDDSSDSGLWKLPARPVNNFFSFFSRWSSSGPWWVDNINRDKAWAIADANNIIPGKVIVAAVDSGVDTDHWMLEKNFYNNSDEFYNLEDDDENGFVDDLLGYDFVGEQGNPEDKYGHGTHVVGLISSIDKNGKYFAIAKNGRVLVSRAIDQSGKSNSIDLARSIDYAVSQGAEIINCSWGGGRPTLVLRDAFQRAHDEGVLIFTSSGNAGINTDESPQVPGGFPGVISIGSIQKNNYISKSSNWGINSVEFLAPGNDIESSLKGGETGKMSGTSMSSAIASSSAAWLMGIAKVIYPEMDRFERRDLVLSVMRKTARRNEGSQKSKYGIIDVGSATDALIKTNL